MTPGGGTGPPVSLSGGVSPPHRHRPPAAERTSPGAAISARCPRPAGGAWCPRPGPARGVAAAMFVPSRGRGVAARGQATSAPWPFQHRAAQRCPGPRRVRAAHTAGICVISGTAGLVWHRQPGLGLSLHRGEVAVPGRREPAACCCCARS